MHSDFKIAEDDLCSNFLRIRLLKMEPRLKVTLYFVKQIQSLNWLCTDKSQFMLVY